MLRLVSCFFFIFVFFPLFHFLGGRGLIISTGHVRVAAVRNVECESGDAVRHSRVSWEHSKLGSDWNG